MANSVSNKNLNKTDEVYVNPESIACDKINDLITSTFIKFIQKQSTHPSNETQNSTHSTTSSIQENKTNSIAKKNLHLPSTPLNKKDEQLLSQITTLKQQIHEISKEKLKCEEIYQNSVELLSKKEVKALGYRCMFKVIIFIAKIAYKTLRKNQFIKREIDNNSEFKSLIAKTLRYNPSNEELVKLFNPKLAIESMKNFIKKKLIESIENRSIDVLNKKIDVFNKTKCQTIEMQTIKKNNENDNTFSKIEKKLSSLLNTNVESFEKIIQNNTTLITIIDKTSALINYKDLWDEACELLKNTPILP